MRVVTLGEPVVAGDQPLFVEFVNTLHWYEGAPIELIGAEAELAAWVAEHGLTARDLHGALPALHLLRDHVRGVTEALARGATPSTSDVEAVVAALGKPAGHMTLLDGNAASPRLSFATAAADADLLALQVALSVAAFLE